MKSITKTISIIIIFTILLAACQHDDSIEVQNTHSAETLALPTAISDKDYSMLSTEKFGWGFKKNVNAPPDITKQQQDMLAKYNAVYMDKNAQKALYLTFDEGYENGYTAKILDILKDNDVKAAFFITAPYLKNSADLVGRMVNEGHIVGNHSVNHPSLPDITDVQKFQDELLKLDEDFKSKFSQNMKYLRPPRGEYSERSLAMSKDLGYINVFWSFAYADWDVKKQKGEEHAYNQIMKGVHDGCILLLHAVSKDNANVLDRVIKDLKQQGYVFKSLDEMA